MPLASVTLKPIQTLIQIKQTDAKEQHRNLLKVSLHLVYPVYSWSFKLKKKLQNERGRTTNGKIGPVADKIYEIWSCTIFVIWVFRGKSKLSIYTKHSSLIINLYEQQALTFVPFSDSAKNWRFCTHIIVNISIPHPSIQKVLIYKESSENALNVCGYKD